MCTREGGFSGEKKGSVLFTAQQPPERFAQGCRAVLTQDEAGKVITSGNHSITLAFPHLGAHIPTLAAAFKGFPVPKVVPFLGWGHSQGLATESSPLPLASEMGGTNLSETTFMDNAWVVWPASVTSKISNHKII